MKTSFERPVGAAADLKELEYIAALHQTAWEGRSDGSIKDEDIQHFLSSRYGIKVTLEEVRETIMNGMGGGSNDTEVIDLMEVTAILLIPTLIKAAEAMEGVELPESMVVPPKGTIEYVLKVLLHDVTGDNSPKELNADLVKRLLLAYGEVEYASDENLIAEMIECAYPGGEKRKDVGEEPIELRSDTFATALTSDIQLYDVRAEAKDTTAYADIWEQKRKTNSNGGSSAGATSKSVNQLHERDNLVKQKTLKRVWTAPSIDTTAGTYHSKALSILLWAFAVVSYFAQWANNDVTAVKTCESVDVEYHFLSPWRENSTAIVCEIGVSIALWFYFFISFCFSGLVQVGLGSVGNFVGCKRWWLPVIGMSFVLIFATSHRILGNDTADTYIQTTALVLGVGTAIFHFLHFLSLTLPRSIKQLVSHTTMSRKMNNFMGSKEFSVKNAGALKTVQMVTNALYVAQKMDKDDGVLASHFGRGIAAFTLHGVRSVETVGGFLWSWRRILSNDIFMQEGIWFSVRLIASNIGQYVVVAYTLITGVTATMNARKNYDTEKAQEQLEDYFQYVFDQNVNETVVNGLALQTGALVTSLLANSTISESLNCTGLDSYSLDTVKSICHDYGGAFATCNSTSDVENLCLLTKNFGSLDQSTQLGLLQASGLDTNAMVQVMRNAVQEAAAATIDSLYPSSRYMVVAPLVVATMIATMTAMYLALTYLPSVTSTTLQFRCGLIPSLHDKQMIHYRLAPDQVAILSGSLFWGCLVSSALVGGFVGTLVFFFTWQATLYFAQRTVAFLLGIIVVTLIRMAILISCRMKLFKSFYRTRPARANFMLLAYEWANFILSVGFVFLRLVKLLIAAGLSIGRIDTPFLSQNAGWLGPIELDNYPRVHRKDILSHEAHRHPYIQILGTMYLLKLRYQDNFCRTAGSIWRLLFVYGLMPWMHQYRILTRPELIPSEEGSEGSVSMIPLTLQSTRDLKALLDAQLKASQKFISSPSTSLDQLEEESEVDEDSTSMGHVSKQQRISQLESRMRRIQRELDELRRDESNVSKSMDV